MTKSTDVRGAMTRLPQYYRILRHFLQEGIYRCSSAEIAAHTEYSAVAVRKDLARFAGCAKQGYGYYVKQLYQALCEYLGVHDQFRAVIVGEGDVLPLVVRHPLFSVHGIRLCGIVAQSDAPSLDVTRITEADLPTFCRAQRVGLLVLLRPLPEPILRAAMEAGICGIFSLCEDDRATRAVAADCAIPVRCLHPVDDLISLCCEMKHPQNEA